LPQERCEGVDEGHKFIRWCEGADLEVGGGGGEGL
jgi:hypothetical protein